MMVVGAAFFALSPLVGETYPGQIPWRSGSLLRGITEAMSLWHLLESARGVEIKEIVLQFGAALLLLVCGVGLLVRKTEMHFERHFRQPWFHGLILLCLWVGISFWSTAWSGDPPSSFSQATLYAFLLAWAVGLALSLQPREIAAGRILLCAAGTIAACLCVWYYYERNPHHRPGFPLGNPATLSASILPAAVLTITFLATAMARRRPVPPLPSVPQNGIHRHRMPAGLQIALCIVSLAAMAWCIVLAASRSTLIGLVVALAVLAFFRLRTRWRWGVFAGLVLVLIGAGFWFMALSSRDISMARGATIRYRLYTWRYAAELWQRNPSLGQGAGAYPRLAGELSALDRALDPGAFLGEIVSHAHNEMFEVFGEIGLVGGVTWVGGMVATAYAALRVLRFRRGTSAYWPSVAMLASFIGLLADSMFSAGMRLPGLPAVFWTVVGLIWADARAVAREHPQGVADLLDSRNLPRSMRTIAVGLACVAAAVGLGWRAWLNLAGVTHEAQSLRAVAAQNHSLARDASANAQQELLDPLRRLLAKDRAITAALRVAHLVATQCRESTRAASQPGSAPTVASPVCQEAAAAVEDAYQHAGRLLRITSGWYRSAAYLAQASELHAQLLSLRGSEESGNWVRQAYAAWQKQRQWLPYDFQTLMRLTHYPATADAFAGLLRDALRSDDFDQQEWRTRLAEVTAMPEFAAAIDRLLQSVGPLTPASDLDLLVSRMAPETYRLAAAWEAQRRYWSSALELIEKAIEMYQPMRVRFPTMVSHALAERAEYQFRADPSRAAQAAATMREAIERLPQIQQQKYEELARPFRELLATFLLTAGDVAGARDARTLALGPAAASNAELAQKLVDLSALFLRTSREHRSIIANWLDLALRLQPDHFGAWSWTAWLAAEHGGWTTVEQVLAEAQRAGINAEQIARIRRNLADFIGPASQPASQSTSDPAQSKPSGQ